MTDLHIRCGSDIRDGLAEAGVPGDFLEWSDPLCRGPAPAGLDRRALIAQRAGWIASAWDEDRDAVAARLTAADAALEGLGAYDRVLLWFEHDPYDQLCLLGLLERLRALDAQPADPRIILVDRHPNHARFIGLGQLAPDELSALHAAGGEPVTGREIADAAALYALFRDAAPPALAAAASETRSGALRCVGPALTRHLQELPGAGDGLSLTERLTLQALRYGAATPAACFRALMERLDPLPFLGDLMYWPDVAGLAQGAEPAIAPAPASWRDPIRLTPFGERLLDGGADWVAANGIARWWGGLFLDGAADWRWDEAAGAPVLGSAGRP
ncbi:MAG: DUF1835 domain-containing protein [Alphaproteobacteria bacterium]|nr:DUF1835 domain-containing protein [Alphaproteobacteria bacterium]